MLLRFKQSHLRNAITYLIVGFSLAFLSILSSGGDVPKKTNVLLITVDTLRADRVSCYDDSFLKTPGIDSLADQGVTFLRAFANTSMTLPSHANILLGVSPLYHGVHENQHFVVRPNFLTLAELLKDAGYATGAFVGAFPLDKKFGLDQGFDIYDDEYGHRSSERVVDLERRAEDVVSKALSWVSSQTSPWFLWVHVYDPHDPYTPPSPYAEKYSNSLYDGEVAYVDDVLGKFIEDLKEAQLWEDTLVIFTGDHGESLGQHGEKTHGFFAYNTGIWIPLIISSLDIETRRVKHPVSHLDIFPTVCDILKLEEPEFLQGRSLLPAMRGRRFPKRSLYFESLSPYYSKGWAPIQGIIRDDMKFIESPIPELYDLSKDFEETDNLAVGRKLDGFRKELKKIIEQYTSDESRGSKKRLDQKSLEKLRSLGYTGGPIAVNPRKSYGPRDDVKTLLPYHNRTEDTMELYREGEVQLAVDTLKTIISEREDLAAAYVYLAMIHSDQKRPQEALEILNEGFSRNPQSYEIFSKYVSTLAKNGRNAEVLELLRNNYLKEMDHDPKIWNLGAMAYLNSSDPDGAKNALDQALSLDPR